MRATLIIFDLDGTLVDTAPEIVAATNDFLAHYGWSSLDADVVTGLIGRGAPVLLSGAIARSRGGDVDEIAASPDFPGFVSVFGHYYEKRSGTIGSLFPGVRETLDRLASDGRRLAVVSNKDYRHSLKVLDAHGLCGYFDPVIGGDTLQTRKPDPAGVRACLEAHSATTAETLFIGDSSVDAETARNAGVACWLLPYGYNMGAPAASVDSDGVLDDFPSIADRLLGDRERAAVDRG